MSVASKRTRAVLAGVAVLLALAYPQLPSFAAEPDYTLNLAETGAGKQYYLDGKQEITGLTPGTAVYLTVDFGELAVEVRARLASAADVTPSLYALKAGLPAELKPVDDEKRMYKLNIVTTKEGFPQFRSTDFAIAFFHTETSGADDKLIPIGKPDDASVTPTNFIHVRYEKGDEKSLSQAKPPRWAPQAHPDGDLRCRFECKVTKLYANDRFRDQYHILLRPDGRQFDPEWHPKDVTARLFKSAARGQRVYVHWLVYKKWYGKYQIIPEGALYKKGATKAPGDFAKWRPTAAVEAGLKAKPADTLKWKEFCFGPFGGGQTVKLSRVFYGPIGDDSLQVYFERRDTFNLRVGPMWTELGSQEVRLAPNPAGQGSVIALADTRKDLRIALSVVASIHGERDFTIEPDNDWHRLNLIAGTTPSAFLKDWFYGVSLEIAPRFDAIVGVVSGTTERPAPGYNVGDVYTGTAAQVPTIETREREWFYGFTYDIGLYGAIFK